MSQLKHQSVRRRLEADGMLRDIKAVGVPMNTLIALMSLPLPEPVLHDFSVVLHRLARGRKSLSTLLSRTAREIEQVILPMPKGMRATFFPNLDADRLVSELRFLRHQLTGQAKLADNGPSLGDFLKNLPKPKKSRPSATSPRDHRIWQLASLFKRSSGSPHYELVADVMNAVYGMKLEVDHVKKAVAKHPNERSCYPDALRDIAPEKIMDRRRGGMLGQVILYSPPVPIIKADIRK